MSTAVVGRGLATGWKGLLITAIAIAAMLALGLGVYRDFDLSFYDSLPDAARALLGIPLHADAAVLAYNEMLASFGALAFVGVAIAIGTQAVAGEEQDRTLSLLLAAPLGRVNYLLSRAAAMVLLLLTSGALLWGIAELAPRILGTDIGDAHLFALMAHLTANAIFHASLALAVGAATGRKALAAGVAATVMVLGWLGTGLLPLWRANAADWIPWTWFNGSKPLVNGIDGGQLTLLLGGAALFLVLGTFAFRARELRLAESSPALIERLRAMPRIGKILSPTGKGSSLFGLRLAAQQVLVGYVVFIMTALMGFSMPLLYGSLSQAIGPLAKSFPQTLADMFGGGSLATAAGFFHLETFGMMAPAAVILVATVAASAGIAGEERTRRMSILLAQPISRATVYWTVAATSAIYVLLVTGFLFLGSWAGIGVSGIDVSIANLGWACMLLTLLGWLFGALALLIAAATGRSSVTVWAATGVSIASYFGYTLLLAAGKDDWGWWSPFRAYLHGPTLSAGLEWWQPAWLAAGAIILLAAGLPLFLRRDLRITTG